MTPDEARALLASFEGRRLAADYETYGLADGYQHIEHYVLLEIDGEDPETGELDVWADPLGVPDKATADMIAAAPALAAMIAGMRTEYAIEHQHTPGGQWHQVTGWSHEPPLNDGHTLTPDERVIRRYVTTPEEIS